jgi:hypothetical protein
LIPFLGVDRDTALALARTEHLFAD